MIPRCYQMSYHDMSTDVAGCHRSSWWQHQTNWCQDSVYRFLMIRSALAGFKFFRMLARRFVIADCLPRKIGSSSLSSKYMTHCVPTAKLSNSVWTVDACTVVLDNSVSMYWLMECLSSNWNIIRKIISQHNKRQWISYPSGQQYVHW